jgi:Mg2+/Co2+ transporter CorB
VIVAVAVVVWVVVVVVLQAPKPKATTSSKAVITTSHFLLNLFDNLRSPFSYFFHYKRLSLRRV